LNVVLLFSTFASMVKRYIYLLLPVVALIAFFIKGDGGKGSIGGSPETSCHTVLSLNAGHSFAFEINKHTQKDNRNAIRIKAWDDAAAVVFPLFSLALQDREYFNNGYVIHYSNPVSEDWVSLHNLRGPPQLIFVSIS